ncbi:hypothetical protein [Paraburkholderia caffeinilytica]|uniref:hypothetical protein n=1 Tax=Paraburkholderia caffeinilytica TaxID=1761016 RepID=UPI003DA05F4C
MIYTAITLDVVLTLCGAWLMATPGRGLGSRLIMAMIMAGQFTDLAGLLWYGKIDVWPGELLGNAGITLLLAQLAALDWKSRSQREAPLS